jgi:hypothetical protein
LFLHQHLDDQQYDQLIDVLFLQDEDHFQQMHQNYKLFDFFQELYQPIYIHPGSQVLNLQVGGQRNKAKEQKKRDNQKTNEPEIENSRNDKPVVSGSLHAANAAMISTIPIIIPTVTGLNDEKTI